MAPALPAALLLALACAGPARALCTSDGVPPPQAVLERFVNADCASCWVDPATPVARPGVLALDWIVPGALGDDAPLAAAASSDAPDRLRTLGRPAPLRQAAVPHRRTGSAPALRLAQGEPVADYIGTVFELAPASGWDAWLLLVEELPVGTEGSPVARRLVRNVFRPDWARPQAADGPLRELRSMQLHAGVRAERLRLVALVQDARGRMRAIGRTACSP